MQSSILILGKPSVGWLPVEIRVNDFHLSFDASDLGLNVIDQLAEMLTRLDVGQASQCYFYLEPGAYILNVEPVSNRAVLRIEFVEDFNNQDISSPETKFKSEINLIEFRTSIRNALRAFRDFDYEMEDWPTPEKNALLSQLLDS
ncbi:MAG: hypothetical protein EOP48_26350 [Sphingobacteriales bacterium]|nr:MAG: hypothetical protein EOP48_26350 [Sphingobacteriales bacterium]